MRSSGNPPLTKASSGSNYREAMGGAA